mmetsp:Transcript_48427/g.49226  ORF Transcript_48427/g.49226 Transcript_48427/m.49226 type:complete len:587 (-) Transcript_48427:671-2431(-)
MPELPEVERFRQILLPLVTTTKQHLLKLELYGEKPPRKWVSEEDVDAYNETGKWCCTDVVRKGKLLCMVLEESKNKKKDKAKKYFFLHMGMTGRVVSKTMSCSWGHKYVSAEEDGKGNWPPRFTYLLLTSGSETVAFADPRKFGSCFFSDFIEEFFDPLAPDGWTETKTFLQQTSMVASGGLANQRLGIKALLLDQKRVVSGVGNWVADEVLYQCELHPDQSYLTDDQSLKVVQTLHSILETAVDCLNQGIPYPETWLFGFRWTKKKAGKDSKGRNLSFLTSGGRTSAIVASIQKLRKCQGKCKKAATTIATNKKKQKEPNEGGGVVKATSSIIKEEEATNRINIKDVVVVTKKRKRTIRVKQEGITNKRGRKSTTSIISVTPDQVPSLSCCKKQEINCQTKTNVKKEPQKKRSRKKQQGKKEETVVVTQQSNDDNDGKQALLQPAVDSSRFQELGFAKWNRSKYWLPIVECGPYHVPPGPVREEWMKRFEKSNLTPRLVYWYGTTWNDLSNSFSFLNPKAIISYEQGIQQGSDQLSSAIQKKMAAGKQLTAKESALVKGLVELKEESELPKKARLSWLNIEEEEG